MKRNSARFLPVVALTGLALTPLTPLTPMPLSADVTTAKAARIDLGGKPLLTAPNPTLPREGKPPAILNVSLPNLQLHRNSMTPAKGTILLLPGGGYRTLAVVHEGLSVAELLNRSGFDVAILEYSVGKEDATIRPQALSDVLRALDLIHLHGKEFGLSEASFGVMGFSAGGHLATRLIHEKGGDVRFSDIILIYPAYLDASNGLKPEVILPKGISPSTRVFVLIGEKDLPERVASSRSYADSAKAVGLDSEFHLLPGTPHAFGIQPGQQGVVGNWPTLLESFLKKGGNQSGS
jgi:hypothetical protein